MLLQAVGEVCDADFSDGLNFHAYLDQHAAVFPLSTPTCPPWPRSTSSRLRKRWKEKLVLWKLVCRWIALLNSLYSSKLQETKRHLQARSLSSGSGGHQEALLRRLWDLAKVCREGRRLEREVSESGGQSAAVKLVKSAVVDNGYARVSKKVSQVPLQAELVAEPSNTQVVNMLAALPRSEAEFYSQEDRCIVLQGKSREIQSEVEEQFAFVGGAYDEYCKYFHRRDLPSNMWCWKPYDQVKAVAGFSCVPKKDGVTQRKLLMCCSFNYLLADVDERSRLGMTGAGALSSVHLDQAGLQVAVCDQSNAFTSVLVPEWMIVYQAVPPLPARDVWELLPQGLQDTLQAHDWVCPCYLRLPMGCSHSVHILMSINLKIIGMTLRSSRLLSGPSPQEVPREECEAQAKQSEAYFGCSDEEWWSRFSRRGSWGEESGYSVDEWWHAIRAARRAPARVFVVMHLFGGERRKEDVHDFVERLAEEAGIKVLMTTVDLATDHRWDLANEETQHEIMSMMSGYVDLLLLGPPCSTVSRARHIRNHVGVRPVRFRNCFWGRHDLNRYERARVQEANILYKHSMALCDRISSYGGSYIWEHPEDPGHDPYPSIFATPEFKALLERTGGHEYPFHQCALGGSTQKPTTLAGNVLGLEDFPKYRCPGLSGSHQHGSSLGFDEAGHFRTRRLQTYPPGMCSLLAKCLVRTCASWRSSGEGPTGCFSTGTSAPITAWSLEATAGGPGVKLLNESVEEHGRVVLGDNQMGVYLHVDDTLVIGSGRTAGLAASLMHEIANRMEEVGFAVPDRRTGDEVKKVIGYEIDAQKGIFALPAKKARLLRLALLELAHARRVDVDLLRALVGIWSFGAQLRRELYSIPFTVYHMLEVCEGQFVRCWPSVRRELTMMSQAVDFMCLKAADPVGAVLFATDASGADLVDNGGYGAVMTQVSRDELSSLFWAGETPGYGAALPDQGFRGFREPFKRIKHTRPFSRLPKSLFEDSRWVEIQAGRWSAADHITIGEARAVTKCLEWMCLNEAAHDHVFFALQDNQPCANSMTKGRSSSWGLNFYLRRRAALGLLSGIRLLFSWCQSALMPADRASRRRA